jgi:hypothetical protein
MLTKKQIHRLLDLTKEEVVIESSDQFPFLVKQPGFGYSKDPELNQIQAALSLMLQVANR